MQRKEGKLRRFSLSSAQFSSCVGRVRSPQHVQAAQRESERERRAGSAQSRRPPLHALHARRQGQEAIRSVCRTALWLSRNGRTQTDLFSAIPRSRITSQNTPLWDGPRRLRHLALSSRCPHYPQKLCHRSRRHRHRRPHPLPFRPLREVLRKRPRPLYARRGEGSHLVPLTPRKPEIDPFP